MMDEKKQTYQFMTILSESHPGLTFEEYRDSCIFLMFYHYLCLRYDDKLDEEYKLHMMVRIAIRGKLQMDSFLRYIEIAAPFFHLVCPEFNLTEFSFYKKLQDVDTLEKQKSYARFIRKIIKKLESWEKEEDLLNIYPCGFESLMIEFSNMRKDTGIPENILELYHIFSEEESAVKKVFQPEFRYGSLLRKMLSACEEPYYLGYEEEDNYIELMRVLCFMFQIPQEQQYFSGHKEWIHQNQYAGRVDTVCVYKPEGVEAGTYLSSPEDNKDIRSLMNSKTKGELPYLLSAFPILHQDGDIMAIMPSSLLYREGRENQIRRYLVEKLNCIDTMILLPESVFPSTGQQEVFLYLKKNRKDKDVLFIDCSRGDTFDQEVLDLVRKIKTSRIEKADFSRLVEPDEIRENEYNLNFPRYIKKNVGVQEVDINTKIKRIEEIERELREIETRIEMYRRDLELDALIPH